MLFIFWWLIEECKFDSVYQSVYKFCGELLENPKVVNLQMIKNLMYDEASNLNFEMPQSHYKNLVRKLLSRFQDQLHFVHVTNKSNSGLSPLFDNRRVSSWKLQI